MKHFALAIAAILSLALVAPVFAQPFADVPTDHWAFDAIAELAAKGLIEGYPDGTFKGDRAMTRYEMAMVVARLLARIEAIKIPEPPKIPAPEVTRADVDRLTRLLNEFRAELAALGVRVTALEEELNALRARLDNTKITGDVRFRYNVFPQGSPNGGGTNRQPDIRLRSRLTYVGQVTPDVRMTLRLWAANNAGGGNFDTRFGNTGVFNSVAFDNLYLDVTSPWLLPIQWRIGRQPITLGGTPPFGFGVGLLFDEGGAGWITGVNDGVTANMAFGPLKLFAFAAQENTASASPGAGSPPLLNYYAVRGSFEIVPGWTLGASFYTERNPSRLTGTLNGLPVPGGVTTRGSGWSFDFGGSPFAGVDFYADYASWSFTGVSAASAWRAGVQLDLGALTGMTQFSPSLGLWYKNYGPVPAGGSIPIHTYACDEILFSQTDCWNMRGWGIDLGLTLTPKLSAAVTYEGYTRISTSQSVNALWARLNYALASRTTLSAQWFKQGASGGGLPSGDLNNFYRMQLTYSW